MYKNTQSYSLLGVEVHPAKKADILEYIIKSPKHDRHFTHIVSINPEIILEARNNPEFKRVIETAQINIIDGAWALLTIQMLYKGSFERVPGVDLMEEVLDLAGSSGLCVGLIGAQGALAAEIADCYQEKYPNSQFFGLAGFDNIGNPQQDEIDALFSIIADRRPHILFFAFGSPAQELWIARHEDKLRGATCMGVGGAFDFIGGTVTRAPKWVRTIYMEWLYRLLKQPWRIARQARLVNYCALVLRQLLRRSAV